MRRWKLANIHLNENTDEIFKFLTTNMIFKGNNRLWPTHLRSPSSWLSTVAISRVQDCFQLLANIIQTNKFIVQEFKVKILKLVQEMCKNKLVRTVSLICSFWSLEFANSSCPLERSFEAFQSLLFQRLPAEGAGTHSSASKYYLYYYYYYYSLC